MGMTPGQPIESISNDNIKFHIDKSLVFMLSKLLGISEVSVMGMLSDLAESDIQTVISEYGGAKTVPNRSRVHKLNDNISVRINVVLHNIGNGFRVDCTIKSPKKTGLTLSRSDIIDKNFEEIFLHE